MLPYYRPTSIPDALPEDPSIKHLLNQDGTVKLKAPMHAPAGTPQAPGFGFLGDERTGILSLEPGRLGVSAFGYLVLEISPANITVHTPAGPNNYPLHSKIYPIDGGCVYSKDGGIPIDGGQVVANLWGVVDGGDPGVVTWIRSRDGGVPYSTYTTVLDGGGIGGILYSFAAVTRDGGSPHIWR